MEQSKANTTLIDGEWLAVELPEGFEIIPHKELEQLMGLSYEYLWGTRDNGRHMLISVTWKDSGPFLTKLVAEKTYAKQVRKAFMRRYRSSNYSCGDIFERAVAGSHAGAYGFGFSYTVEGVVQEGEALVFKRGIRCYTMLYYTRSEVAERNRPTWDGIVDSLEVR